MHRAGTHPHISIEDRIFVETVGGDLTVKVEDNTATGQGIYSEPVTDSDQTLDDAEIFYATVGSLILLKILPYRESLHRHLIYNEKTNYKEWEFVYDPSKDAKKAQAQINGQMQQQNGIPGLNQPSGMGSSSGQSGFGGQQGGFGGQQGGFGGQQGGFGNSPMSPRR